VRRGPHGLKVTRTPWGVGQCFSISVPGEDVLLRRGRRFNDVGGVEADSLRRRGLRWMRVTWLPMRRREWAIAGDDAARRNDDGFAGAGRVRGRRRCVMVFWRTGGMV